MESFSAYARQFMGQMERPDVDQITGLSPVIAIEQKLPIKIQDLLLEQLPSYTIFEIIICQNWKSL